ncbi:MAG: poly-gamma-glutamate hydrolase family protein [Acidobacteria bacterium]|nr:poly-gamma-glutamate hydrolase family protein [Acidobacteriota bacterium]
MSSQDTYRNFAELSKSERETRDYRRVIERRNSKITIIAPHGGGIEPGTSEIAKALAGGEFSLYCLEGLKVRGNYEALHITGTNFDDPACVQLVNGSNIVLAIHGCDSANKAVYVGGLNGNLKAQFIEVLRDAGFHAEEDVSSHSGSSSQNICNRGVSDGGVQLEISEGLRRTMFSGLNRRERQITTPIFDEFVAVIRAMLFRSEVA